MKASYYRNEQATVSGALLLSYVTEIICSHINLLLTQYLLTCECIQT